MSNIIDHKKIRLPYNYVLVKPDEEMEKYHYNGKETSLYVGKSHMTYVDPNDSVDFEQQETVITQANHWAITGEVLVAPDRLAYYGERVEKIRSKADLDDYDIIEMNKLSQASLKYDVPQEIKAGDRVLFDANIHISTMENLMQLETDIGVLYLIKYDQLRGIIREDEIYPLNSIVFFKWDKINRSISKQFAITGKYDHISDASPTEGLFGEVFNIGANCRAELEGFKHKKSGIHNLKKGSKFIFKMADANNVENEGHHYLFGGEEIYMIRQSDILMEVD